VAPTIETFQWVAKRMSEIITFKYILLKTSLKIPLIDLNEIS